MWSWPLTNWPKFSKVILATEEVIIATLKVMSATEKVITTTLKIISITKKVNVASDEVI